MSVLKHLKLCQVLMLVIVCCHTTCGNHDNPLTILLVSAPAVGHMTPLVSLGQELSTRGHQVQLCSTVIEGSNITEDIAKNNELKFINAGKDTRTVSEYSALIESLRGTSVYWSLLVAQMAIADSEKVIVDHLNTPDFTLWDVVVFDYVLEGSGLYLSAKWEVPVVINSPGVAFSPMLQPPWPFPSVGSSWGDDLSFWHRLYQSVVWPIEYSLKLAIILYSKMLNVHQTPPLCDSLCGGAGLGRPLLINTVTGLDYARPHTHLTHYTGPLITDQASKQLSLELNDWLTTQYDGVIFISMGSLARLTPEMVDTITQALTNTKHSALWSTGSTNESLFKNVNSSSVKLVNWVPQREVLQHSNVKLAILHGGINGLQESIANGVPVLCLPQLFDQHANAQRIVNKKLGLSLDPLSMTSEQLAEAITAIWSEYDTYKAAVQKVSLLFKHAGGVKMAADFVEYYHILGTHWKETNHGLCTNLLPEHRWLLVPMVMSGMVLVYGWIASGCLK